ncbi:hypothetical protein C0J52_28330 [Blattella germanica]|nr:hypothetical protein C0J52_28330 [Blattella germanica]
MATSGVERAFCVLEFDKNKSATDVQRKFRTKFNKEAPSRKSIYAWHVTTGCLCPKKGVALLHQLKPNDKQQRYEFCSRVQQVMDENENFVDRIIFRRTETQD